MSNLAELNKVDEIRFLGNQMQMVIGGKTFLVNLQAISPKLLAASEVEKNMFRISPSGYGIHWPLIDEDLSVDFLIKSVE
jgi:hypothetical protein